MDKQTRDEIRKICDAATPGPWIAAGTDETSAAVYHDDFKENQEYSIAELRRDDDTSNPDQYNAYNDAVFIARARTALPEALDAMDVETKRAEALERALRTYTIDCQTCEKFKKCSVQKTGCGCDDWQFDEARFAEGGERE